MKKTENKTPQEIANDIYPDYLVESNCAYDDDFMKSNADKRNAFLAGYRNGAQSSGEISTSDYEALEAKLEHAELGRTCAYKEAERRLNEWSKCQGQVEALKADRDRLLEAIKPLAAVPLEEFGYQSKPSQILMAWNHTTIVVADVLKAREALASRSPSKGDKV